MALVYGLAGLRACGGRMWKGEESAHAVSRTEPPPAGTAGKNRKDSSTG